MEETNEAWKMLLESLDNKDNQILDMKKREIDLLQKLMKTEENVKGLIKVIAELKFPPKPPEEIKETQEDTDQPEDKNPAL